MYSAAVEENSAMLQTILRWNQNNKSKKFTHKSKGGGGGHAGLLRIFCLTMFVLVIFLYLYYWNKQRHVLVAHLYIYIVSRQNVFHNHKQKLSSSLSCLLFHTYTKLQTKTQVWNYFWLVMSFVINVEPFLCFKEYLFWLWDF